MLGLSNKTMLTTNYSYADCLNASIKSAWTVEDCFQGRRFDFSGPVLPDRIAGVREITCLSEDEKRILAFLEKEVKAREVRPLG